MLEILVAFSILALSLGVLLRVFSKNVELTAVSDDYTKAVLLAESQLADATAGELEEGDKQGVFADRYRWAISINEYNPEFEDFELDNLPFVPYQIKVNVEWDEGENPRFVELTTLRIGSRT